MAAARLAGAAAAAAAVRGALAGGECWDWAFVQDKGWSCGGSYNANCGCPHGKVQHSCVHDGTAYYSCKSSATVECLDWSIVEQRGWSCGGNYDPGCTCPSGKVQNSCEYGGKTHYSCKDEGSPGTPSPPVDGPVGIAKTDGCSCTKECNDDDWCHADCDDWGWDWCTKSDGSSGSHTSPSGKSVGQFMADFVKSQDGKYVTSELQGSATCWDLARRAMEEAKDAGYHIEHGRSYVWSDTIVDIEDALPGDIAQFTGWKEQWWKAWNPHTAVVVEPWNEEEGGLPTMDQNPDPVHATAYYPRLKVAGGVTIYRIVDRSPSRLYSASLPRLLRRAGARPAALAAAGAALAAAAAFAACLQRLRARPRPLPSEAPPWGAEERALVAERGGAA